MSGDFTDITISEGTQLHIHNTEKFKSNLISIYIHQQLSEEYVTQHALLPEILLRGCEDYPSQTEIQRKLQSLYGAELSSSVSQWGNTHSISLQLELIEGRYIPGDVRLLAEGMELLGDIIFKPLRSENGNSFRADYVSQEKNNLHHRIDSLINDKARYASKRCLEEMFEQLPYGLYTYGRIEDLPSITAESLFAYYQHVMNDLPMDIFVVTSKPVDEVVHLVKERLERPRPGKPRTPFTPYKLGKRPLQEVIEEQPVQQGKLCLGYRTNVYPGTPHYHAMTVYNGILGGFVHSKLFRNVREKASLAYYASSRVDGLRGVMLISSGIDVANYEKALSIIEEQVEEMRQGKILDEELVFTKKALANLYRTLVDSPSSMSDRAMYGIIAGMPFDWRQRLQEIEKVTKEQIVEMAQHIQLDTIYFLTKQAAEGAEQ